MPTLVRQVDRRRIFGSLNDGVAITALGPEECPLLRNVSHELDGAITKRKGKSLFAEVAAHDGPDCALVTAAFDEAGVLTAVQHDVLVTYATAAGETDTLGVAPFQVTLNAKTFAIDVRIPFHLRKRTVNKWYDLPAYTAGLPSFPPELLVETVVTGQSLGLYAGGPVTLVIGVPGEPLQPPSNRRIKPGSLVLFFDGGGGTTLVDDGFGAVTGPGVDTGTIDYNTGTIVLTWTVDPSGNMDADFIIQVYGRVYMIGLEDGPPITIQAACPDAFEGYLVYSRAPRVQDETLLGANFEAAEPLYHRVKELAQVYSWGTYDGAPVFVLDRRTPQIGQTGKVDRDTVDVMMPDRAGLPILYWNVYAKRTVDSAYRLGATGTNGYEAARVLSIDATAAQPPHQGTERGAPVLATGATTRTLRNGAVVSSHSGIPGGIYAIQTAWGTGDLSVLQAPGYDAARTALGLSGARPALRCRQETWPSTRAFAQVRDGESITVTPPARPDIASSWSLYAEKLEPFLTLGFQDSIEQAEPYNPLNSTKPFADYAGDGALTLAAANAAIIGTLNSAPTGFPQAGYGQFESTGTFPPSYENISDDEPTWGYSSGRGFLTDARLRFWFPIDTVIDAATVARMDYAVLRLKLRVRRNNATTYSPATTLGASIRVWSATGSIWGTLKSGIKPTDGFVEHAFGFAAGVAIGSLFNVQNGNRWYAVFDIIGLNGLGLDVDTIHLDLMDAADATLGTVQKRGITDTSYTLRHPLARDVERNETVRQNNTASWPVMGYAAGIVGDDESLSETFDNFFGVADSVFRWKRDGTVERVFQQEDEHFTPACRNDFQFANYTSRTFFCNPGIPTWNLRFDGRQTFPMGLAKPEEEGEILSVSEPAPGALVVEDQEIEYYVVYKRVLEALNRGYVVRSAPLKFTDTVKVNIKEGIESACLIVGTLKPEPEVTHVEIYRNYIGTAFYARVADIEIVDSLVQADGSVSIRVEDAFDGTDGDLDLPIEFETGRPPAATVMLLHRGRVWFVDQTNRELISFTNVTSPSGLVNPEGFFATHTVEPPMRFASAVDGFSAPGGLLVAHSAGSGMVAVDGISDDQNSQEALTTRAIYADGGWVGPRAHSDFDAIEYGMTPLGPGILAGGEFKFIGTPVQGTIADSIRDPAVVKQSHVLKVDDSIWFTFSEDPVGCMTSALVLAREVTAEGDRLYWTVFDDLECHSIITSKVHSRLTVTLICGHAGRVFRYGGRAKTDAGLFIEARAKTRPIVEGETGRSFQPRSAYLYMHGDRKHVMLVKIRKDYRREDSVAPRPLEVPCNEHRTAQDFGVGAYLLDGNNDFGPTDENLALEHRQSLGQVYRQMQFEFYQTLEDLPPGTPREATFQASGFILFHRMAGPRAVR